MSDKFQFRPGYHQRVRGEWVMQPDYLGSAIIGFILPEGMVWTAYELPPGEHQLELLKGRSFASREEAGEALMACRARHPNSDGWTNPVVGLVQVDCEMVWRASVADTSFIQRGLASLGAWPADRPLPPSVRWLPEEEGRALSLEGMQWHDGVAGAVVWCFGPKTGDKVTGMRFQNMAPDGSFVPWMGKVSEEPVTETHSGDYRPRSRYREHLPYWTVTGSVMKGMTFRVPGPNGQGDSLHVVKTPIDALAVSFWHGVEAWCFGEMSKGLLESTGRPVVMENEDVLNDVVSGWEERAAIIEADGVPREEANAAAWRDALDQGGRHG